MIKYNSKSIALSKYGEQDPPHIWINLYDGMPSGTRIILPDGTTGTFFKNTDKRKGNMTDSKDMISRSYKSQIGKSPVFNEKLCKYRLHVRSTKDVVIKDNLIIWSTGKSVFDSTVVSIITPGDSVVLQTTDNDKLAVTIEMRGKVIATYRDTNGSTLVIVVDWEGNLRYSGELGDGVFAVV